MAKLMSLVALLGCLTATQAAFDPQKLVTLVDVGSGGTRLVMFMKQDDGKVTACCKDECSTEKSEEVIQCSVGTSRYSANTTIKDVATYSSALFDAAYATLKSESEERCPSLFTHISESKQNYYDSIKGSLEIRVLATAGARITAVNSAILNPHDNKFATIVVAGFQQMLQDPTGNYKMDAPPASTPSLVQGAIMDGTYEAYFGLVNGFNKVDKIPIEGFDAKKAIYFEVGGASQQIGWHTAGTADPNERFVRQSTMLRSGKSRGPMDMAYPVTNVAGHTDATSADDIAHKHVFAASILGTGTDRFTVHLLRHAVRTAEGDTAVCPCLPAAEPDAQHHTVPKMTTLKWDHDGNRIEMTGMDFKGIGDYPKNYPNGVKDSAADEFIADWLKANPNRKIVPTKNEVDLVKEGEEGTVGEPKKNWQIYNHKHCTRFIKKMFRDQEEKDDVGGTKRTFHAQFQKWQAALKDAKLYASPGKIVFNSNALTSAGHSNEANKQMTYEKLTELADDYCYAKDEDLGTKDSPFAFPKCIAASQALVFIQELFGEKNDGSLLNEPNNFPHMVLSEDKDIKKKLFIIPIATSWTAVAAEYVLDQKQYQDDKGGIKQWRPFKSDETHASEDAHWADTNSN